MLTHWLTASRRWRRAATTCIGDRFRRRWEQTSRRVAPDRCDIPSALTDDLGTPELDDGVTESIMQRLPAGARILYSTVTAIITVLTVTGLAGAQPSDGGVCGTPVVALFEWAVQTGAGVLFLGGLLYGGYKHARAGMSRDPESANLHRRTGTMAMVSGPIFGIIIVLGEQAAGAVGLNVAQCAELTPWF